MPISLKCELVTTPRDLLKRLVRADPELKKALLQQSKLIMVHAVVRSRRNAPVLSGDLRGSLKFAEPSLTGGGVISSGIGSELPYALRWHEEDFNLGPVSILEPSTVEGGVGKKYISRVMNYHRQTYAETLMGAVTQTIRRGKATTIRLPRA